MATSLDTTDRSRFLRDGLGIMPEADLAEILGLGVRTLAEYRRNGGAPDHVTVGSAIYYRIEAVRDWLARNEQVAGRGKPAPVKAARRTATRKPAKGSNISTN